MGGGKRKTKLQTLLCNVLQTEEIKTIFFVVSDRKKNYLDNLENEINKFKHFFGETPLYKKQSSRHKSD